MGLSGESVEVLTHHPEYHPVTEELQEEEVVVPEDLTEVAEGEEEEAELLAEEEASFEEPVPATSGRRRPVAHLGLLAAALVLAAVFLWPYWGPWAKRSFAYAWSRIPWRTRKEVLPKETKPQSAPLATKVGMKAERGKSVIAKAERENQAKQAPPKESKPPVDQEKEKYRQAWDRLLSIALSEPRGGI